MAGTSKAGKWVSLNINTLIRKRRKLRENSVRIKCIQFSIRELMKILSLLGWQTPFLEKSYGHCWRALGRKLP